MATTIHAVFIEEDHIPSLMGLIDECWSAKIEQTQTENALGAQSPLVLKSMPSEDQTTHLLLQKFSNLQSAVQCKRNLTELITDVKDKFEEMFSNIKGLTKLSNPTYTAHTIISSEGGLVWLSDVGLRKKYYDSSHLIQYLTEEVYNKHSMLEFSNDIYVSHLDKAPKYSILKIVESNLGDVEEVKPEIKKVHMHNHGNETAIVIEGHNLWFCYHISFRERKVLIPASDISSSSINFNVAILKPSDQEEENVALGNYFRAKPIKKTVKVHKEEFMTTVRQDQLAKLTPSQVIELAYLSALLEQFCDGVESPRISYKFEVIKTFLENVVKVVPFESIGYAIVTNDCHETALQCAKALKATRITIPSSTLMSRGLSDAAYHLKFGVPLQILHSMQQKLFEEISTISQPFYLRMPDKFLYLDTDSKKLVYKIASPIPIPGTNFGIMEHAPIKITQIDVKHLKPTSNAMKEIADDLFELQNTIVPSDKSKMKLIGTANIEDLYPVRANYDDSFVLKSPLNTLVTGRKQLMELSKVVKSSSESPSNQKMLKTLNHIRQNDLSICTSLLGGFMHQNEMRLTLASPHKLTSGSEVLYIRAPASVGVWALFSLDYTQVQSILAKCHGNELLLKLSDYVKGISGIHEEPENIPMLQNCNS